MFGWLSQSALPTEERIAWMFEVYGWLLAHLGGLTEFRKTRLVLPTPEFYPVEADEPDALARALFELTRRHAGMVDWPCELRAHRDMPSATDILGHVPHAGLESDGAAGTISLDASARAIVITYSPRQLSDPESFVATIAHELSHYLLAGIAAPPPGGPELHEPTTDLGAVFLGFGIFQANSTFSFRQFQDANMQGWEARRLGYLSEQELAYALGIFLSLLDIPVAVARRHLRANPSSYLKHAMRDLAKNRATRLEALRVTATVRSSEATSIT